VRCSPVIQCAIRFHEYPQNPKTPLKHKFYNIYRFQIKKFQKWINRL